LEYGTSQQYLLFRIFADSVGNIHSSLFRRRTGAAKCTVTRRPSQIDIELSVSEKKEGRQMYLAALLEEIYRAYLCA